MKIAIVDYGLGNLFSIQRAISYLGMDSMITDNPDEILGADRIILPGVGAFADGMKGLKEKGLDRILHKCAEEGKPILGICLGMQLLMTESEEFGLHLGLDLIPGRVIRFPEPKLQGLQYKIPHVGWSQVFPKKDRSSPKEWEKTVLAKNSPGDYFYFVHSYHVVPDNPENTMAIAEYGGMEFCSMVRDRHIFGCQFHPELSGETGIKIYREFIEGDLGV